MRNASTVSFVCEGCGVPLPGGNLCKACFDKKYPAEPPRAPEQGALLPCPFCGSIDLEIGAWVECSTCRAAAASGSHSSKAEAIAAWNTRAVPDLRPSGLLEKVGWFFSSILDQPRWPDVDDLLKLCYQRAIESSSAPLGELLIAYCRSRDRADSLAALVAELVEALTPFAELDQEIGECLPCHNGITTAEKCVRCSKVLAARAALARAHEVKP